MSNFYGYLRGNRGPITRSGSKKIYAHLRSATNDVYATLWDDKGVDKLRLIIPKELVVSINKRNYVITIIGDKQKIIELAEHLQ